jgi:hypothetical protein
MDTRQQRAGCFAWVAAGLLGLPALVSAAESESTPPPQQQVTVEAHRESVERRVQDYVSQITTGPTDESLERWTLPMCPMVAGLTAKQGEMVLTRVSQIARVVGAPLGPEKCQANLIIVVTPDPKNAIEAWRKRSSGQIFNGASSLTIRHFIETAVPVRAWYNARVVDGHGVVLTGANVTFNHMGGEAGSRASVNNHASNTRLELGTVKDLGAVFLIVDAHNLEHVQIGQLADYIGMVGLAKLDTAAHPGAAPTILSLFASADGSQPPPAGLTEWDEAFLKALYHTDPAARMQRAAITRSIAHEIDPDPATQRNP